MKKGIFLVLVTVLFAALAIAQDSTINPTAPEGAQTAAQQPAPQPDQPAQTEAPAQTTTPAAQQPSSSEPNAAAPQERPSTAQDVQNQNPPVLEPRPAQTPATRTARGRQIPAGTEIRAVLDEALSTKTAHVGQTFTATVSQPVDAGAGVAIPRGAKVHGEVTEVQRGKTLGAVTGNKGRLNMRFREITLPNGERLPLEATLVSVHETKGTGAKTGNEGEVQGGTSGKRTAKDVGIGAGVGTVAGLIFGHALRGLAIGAVAGGGYVLATTGKDVEIPAESGVVLRLDRAVTVPSR